MIYRFADCALDTQLYTLQRADQSTRLAPKVFEVLCYLIEHRDRVISKQELCEQVWEGIAITDATLESCLRAVRGTVGDSGQGDCLREPILRFTLCTAGSMPSNNAKRLLSCCFAVTEHL